jgi:hypothetical protein
MISGGDNVLAIDDGSNSDYSSLGSAGFPVIQSGPLDYWGSSKGFDSYFVSYFVSYFASYF